MFDEMSFEEQEKQNVEKLRVDFLKAIEEFAPERALLIMGKHVGVEKEIGKYVYIMRITENLIDKRIDNFLNILLQKTRMLMEFEIKANPKKADIFIKALVGMATKLQQDKAKKGGIWRPSYNLELDF